MTDPGGSAPRVIEDPPPRITAADPQPQLGSQPALGQRLKELRLRRGLSQADLAGETLSPSAVSLLESGRREPTMRTLDLLAERLGCTVEFLRDGVEAQSGTRSRLTLAGGYLLLYGGDPIAALRRFNEALVGKRLSSDVAYRARLGRALAVEAGGDADGALAALEQLATASTGAGAGEMAWLPVDVALCRLYRRTGQHERCVELALRALELSEALGMQGLGDHSELVTILIRELHERGDTTRAVALARTHMDTLLAAVAPARAAAYAESSRRAESMGRLGEALLLAERSVAVYREVADARSGAVLRSASANLLLQADPPELVASTVLEQAHEVLNVVGGHDDLAFCETGLAQLAVLRGQPELGAGWAERALARLGGGPSIDAARALIALGTSHRAMGDDAAALRRGRAADEVLRSLPHGRCTAVVWRELGTLLRSAGDSAAALEAYERALAGAGLGSPYRY